MKNRYRWPAWLAIALLVVPAALPAMHADVTASAPPKPFIWHDKPLKPLPAPYADLVTPRVTGHLMVLMLCVDFTNVKHSSSHTVLYEKGLGDSPTNSMATYYAEASYGKLTLSADCFGWYNSTKSMDSYGAPSGGDKDNPLLYQLVTEAIQAADPYVDFSRYDQDGDGYVDYLMVVHAGNDEAMSGQANDIWSERYFDFDQPTVDGLKVGPYSMVSEYDPMGVLAHEFGHQLGLPDLYDTDGPGSGGETQGAGLWDIMAAGAYLGYGDTPCLPSAWCRAQLGWADVVTVTADSNGILLGAASRNSTVLRINIPYVPSEYFLVENRATIGYDSYLPGNGLLIWHIDDSYGTVDQNDLEVRPGHKRVTLEEAHGGLQDLDHPGTNLGDARDPWFSTAAGFGPTSDPNSTAYIDGRQSFISVKNISPPGAVMTCDVVLDTRVYDISMTPSATQILVDPGTTVQFNVDLFNRGSEENYSFLVEGPHSDWFTVNPASAKMAPLTAAGLTVSVHPPFNTTANLTWENSFKATPASDPTRSFSFKLSTKVNPKLRSAFSPSQDLRLLAGESRLVNITVSNLGNVPDTITLSLAGLGLQWIRYDGPTSFQLGQWTNTTISIVAAIPWGTAENERAYVQVGGRSRDGTISTTATLNFTAAPSQFVMFDGPDEVHVRPGEQSKLLLNLTNAGTSDAELLLSTGIDAGWFANLSQPFISLPAWSTQEIQLTLTPAPDAGAGLLTAVNLTASTAGYSNSTSVLVTVDQVFGSAIADCSTSAEVLPGVPHQYFFNVKNTGNGQDELRFSIAEGDGGDGWTEAMDAEPTRLRPGQSAPVLITVTAPAGAGAGLEWHLSLIVQHTGVKTDVFDIDTVVARVQAVTLAASQNARTGAPGETVQFTLTAGNAGDVPDSMVFSAPRQEGLTYTYSETGLDLAPGRTGTMQFTCRILSDALAGVRSVNLSAASRNYPSVNATVELRITITPVYDGGLLFPQTQQEGAAGRAVVFQCTLVNKGNTKDTFIISKATGAWNVAFDRTTVALGPGERATVNITISIPADEGGGARIVKISLHSQGKNAEVFLKELTVVVSARTGPAATGVALPLVAIAAALAVAAVAVFIYMRAKRAQGGPARAPGTSGNGAAAAGPIARPPDGPVGAVEKPPQQAPREREGGGKSGRNGPGGPPGADRSDAGPEAEAVEVLEQ
jgi:immune inhibitor A